MRGRIIAIGLIAATAAQGAEPLDGRAQFRAHCGMCHLEGGTGTIMLGRRVAKGQALLESRSDLQRDYVRTVVRHGLNSMPALTRVEVDDAALDEIAAYLAKAPK